jgi:hypothetical protein
MLWEKSAWSMVLKNKAKLQVKDQGLFQGYKKGVHGHGLAHRLFSPFLYHRYSRKTPSGLWVFPLGVAQRSNNETQDGRTRYHSKLRSDLCLWLTPLSLFLFSFSCYSQAIDLSTCLRGMKTTGWIGREMNEGNGNGKMGMGNSLG